MIKRAVVNDIHSLIQNNMLTSMNRGGSDNGVFNVSSEQQHVMAELV